VAESKSGAARLKMLIMILDEIHEDIRNLFVRLLYGEKTSSYDRLLRCAKDTRLLSVRRITSILQDNTGGPFAIVFPDREIT
jgi:hypothetical protein